MCVRPTSRLPTRFSQTLASADAATNAMIDQAFTHRPQSSSLLGLPCRILNMNHKKELLWGLRVRFRAYNSRAAVFVHTGSFANEGSQAK